MKTLDQLLKIRAVVLYILEAFSDGVDYIKLFKIIYFAQRDHLVKYGRLICDDTFQARQFGPVPGLLRKTLKRKELGLTLSDDLSMMCEGIEVITVGKCQVVKSSERADMDELSGSEKKCLDSIIDKFRDIQSDEVSKLSHDDRAWQMAYERAKTDPQLRYMTLLEIAEAGGADTNTMDYIRENLELDEALL